MATVYIAMMTGIRVTVKRMTLHRLMAQAGPSTEGIPVRIETWLRIAIPGHDK
jgi:hypothetical protein